MARVELMYSKERVKKAGATLRSALNGEPLSSADEIFTAVSIVDVFRAAHQDPLTRVAMGLRSMVKTVGAEQLLVAQRLKRMPQIANKLLRFPTMSLARMEDIGGCRAVLADRDEIERVQDRINRNKWDIKNVQDYIAEPKPTGYRAVHAVVVRDGRLIEVQLRTQGQQAWAIAVEGFASKYDLPLKDGRGPDVVLEFFRVAGDLIALMEVGEGVPDVLEDRRQQLLTSVQDWIEAAGRGEETWQ